MARQLLLRRIGESLLVTLEDYSGEREEAFGAIGLTVRQKYWLSQTAAFIRR